MYILGIKRVWRVRLNILAEKLERKSGFGAKSRRFFAIFFVSFNYCKNFFSSLFDFFNLLQ